jgi:hypothetical protein
MPVYPIFTVLGSACLMCCIGTLIALHLLPTGCHPIHDPVSNYAVGRNGYLYRAQALSSGICGCCLLALLAWLGGAWPTWGVVGLACYALSRLLIIFFPTDIGPNRTPSGRVHVVLAAFTFAGIAVASGTLSSALAALATWSRVGSGLHAAAWLTDVAAILFLVVFVVRPLRRIVGLVERGIYLGTVLWLGIVFAPLLASL